MTDDLETFLIRTTGGPLPGDRMVSSAAYTWPLPDVLPFIPPLDSTMRGSYVKTNESQLPPQAPDSPIMRGAQYEWRPAEEEVEVP